MAMPLLILDLDETLLYACEMPLERAADFRIGKYHAYRRPYLGEFLAGVASRYRLAVWTSASSDYARIAVGALFPDEVTLDFVWSAERCVRRRNPETMEQYDVKDLRKVVRRGYAIERILMIDDSPEKLERHYGNHIKVRPYLGEVGDEELKRLLPYVVSLGGCENYRCVEKRDWRAKG